MNNDVDRLKKMSFNELKIELRNNIDNPVREYAIRKMMKDKYEKHLQEKNRIKIQEQKKIYNQKLDDEILNILDDKSNSSDQSSNSSSESSDSSESIEAPTTFRDVSPDKFKEKIKNDYVNNNLMQRLNSDIDITSMRNKKNTRNRAIDIHNNWTRNKNDIVPPFDTDYGDAYAPFDTNIPTNDFSNKRLINKK